VSTDYKLRCNTCAIDSAEIGSNKYGQIERAVAQWPMVVGLRNAAAEISESAFELTVELRMHGCEVYPIEAFLNRHGDHFPLYLVSEYGERKPLPPNPFHAKEK